MKKRWIAAGIGAAAFCTLGYFAWREFLSGGLALSGRDYAAERAALAQSMQTDAGRTPGATDAVVALDLWRETAGEIASDQQKAWAGKGKKFPGFGVPLRTGSPKRTPENAAELADQDAASIEFYERAVKEGLPQLLSLLEQSPRAGALRTRPAHDMGSDDGRSGALRELARLCRYRMVLAAGVHDETAYLAALRQGLRLADLSARQPGIIDRFVAVAVLSLLEGGIREDLAIGRVSPALADLAARAVADAYAAWPRWSCVFEGEALDTQEVLRRDARFIGGPEVARIRWAFDRLAGAADLPRGQRVTAFDEVDAAIAHAPAWHLRMRIFLPAVTAVGRAKDQIEADTAGLLVVAAVEKYRAEKGSLPDSLDALVPGYLSAVPPDPFGTRLLYKRLDAPDRFGRRYTVYSVGLDGRDDGGRAHPAGAREALRASPGSVGTDYPVSRVDD